MTDGDLLLPLMECLPEAAIASDRHGRIVKFNTGASRMLGWSASEAIDQLRTLDIYADVADAREVMVRLRQRTSGLPGAAEPMNVDLRRRDGSTLPVRLCAARVRGASGWTGTVGVFVDRRPMRAMDERLRLATELVADREKRIEATSVGPRLASELAQPLTAALAHLDLVLETGGLPDRTEDRLMQALEQLDRVRALVHELTRVSTHWKAHR